jgi:hypothetical protein
MAFTDAFWRAWIKLNELRTDNNSLFHHIKVLREGETGKFVSNPTFRQMHDVIHDLWASMLDWWPVEAQLMNLSWKTLKDFAVGGAEM